ncbi:damage-control phosphatase ARMT1 family protein [Streptomyces sp. NPDC020141]|uniref:damage-control phosphatase ARMT1 family protein n=1 Tax=Streptomyces sp. NPDC020141 TaxID=3365065 RepID=UPI0037A4FC3F
MSASGEAPVILSDEPGSFAHSVLADRHPALVRRVRDAFPWGPAQHRALDALLAEITAGVIEPLGPGAHDRAEWERWGRRDGADASHSGASRSGASGSDSPGSGTSWFGTSWFEAPFLWAESYFYRRLLGALDHFTPGPWQGVDPFGPFKQAELHAPAVDGELAALDALPGRPADEQAHALLHASLWGNRADLGFRLDSGGGAPAGPQESPAPDDPRLVADDSAVLWSLLPPDASAAVHLIADNAGQELIPDLVLLDHLLHTGRAGRAALHIKPHPYYVSDATMTDVLDALRRLRRAPGYAAGVGDRLWSALTDGRLDVRAHPFFCAPLPYSAMPADLRADLSGAAVTILKGDLNYRRLVGDRHWPATDSFHDRTAHFPGAVAALRTLKSDVLVGLHPQTLTTLDHTPTPWRTTGTHALIQARP